MGGYSPALAIAVDGKGNVIGAGYAERSNEDRVFIVAKFSGPDGSLMWLVEIDGAANGSDVAFDVAVDANDDVVAVGWTVNPDTAADFTVVKLNGLTGKERWRRIINGPANKDDFAGAVAIDSTGHVVVVGTIVDHLPAGNTNAVKLSGADGATLWTRSLAGQGYAVSVDSDDSLIVAATNNDNVSFAKFTRDGKVVWVREIPHADCCKDKVLSVALDSQGNVLAAGEHAQDFAVTKLAADTGAIMWSQQISGTAELRDEAHRLAVDRNDDVFVAGFTRNSASRSDFTVLKVSGSSGAIHWLREVNGVEPAGTDYAQDVAVDPAGGVYAAGYLRTEAPGAGFAVLKFASEDGSELWRYSLPVRSRGRAIALDAENKVIAAGEISQNGSSPVFAVVKLNEMTGLPTAKPDNCPDCNVRPLPWSGDGDDEDGKEKKTARLNWQDNSTDEDGFRLYRTTPDGMSLLEVTGANVTTFVTAVDDPGAGLSVCFRVAAFNEGGESALSNLACLPVKENNTVVTLSWRDNSENEDGFKIYRLPATKIDELGPNVTSYVDEEARSDSCFLVTAFNSMGESRPSNVACLPPAETRSLTSNP